MSYSMKSNLDFKECSEKAKVLLENSGFEISDMKKFEHHIQYRLQKDDKPCGHLRFYKSKSGTTVDDSQVSKSCREIVKEAVSELVDIKEKKKSKAKDVQDYNVIGTDESGKGDFFGPLVIAAVYVKDKDTRDTLLKWGITDSKKISDDKVAKLADRIKGMCNYSLVRLPPETYNRLYEDFGNLNYLMGWAHARAMEDLLEEGVEPDAVISDKFGSESHIRDELMEHGKDVRLVQEVRAEQNVAVAAASILARSEFLMKLSGLGMNWNVELPKGAGGNVVEAGKEFVKKHSEQDLEKVAKLHFKTKNKILK